MKERNFIEGRKNEALVCKFLKDKGYKILENNYTTKLGEIDIIAKDGDVIVFVEVKYRLTDKFGMPAEAVNYTKQQKIRRVALLYLQANKLNEEEIRFDVVEVLNDQISHIENAF